MLIHLDNVKTIGDRKFVESQYWQGYITQIQNDVFEAVIYDQTNKNNPEEIAVIPMNYVSPSDLAFVHKGAYFYWKVGYFVDASGTIRNVEYLKFIRPYWSAKMEKELQDSIKRYHEMFGI